MDKEGFCKYLDGRNTSKDAIRDYIALAERFENFLAKIGNEEENGLPDSEDVLAFSALLIQERLNTIDNYLALVRYGQFLNNDRIFITAVNLVDGAEVMDNLYHRLGEEVGDQKRDEIFEGIELPPMGTPSSEKPRITKIVMERLQSQVDPELCRKLLSPSLRTLDGEQFLEDRKKYLECGNLEVYLVRKGQEFIAELEQIQSEGKLYFTQEITDEVLDFVRNTPLVAHGVREGNILYEVKIPYMSKEYLAETDDRMKRYYYCHCPWVRESNKDGNLTVPSMFCHCSAGFVKKPWEVIFDQPLEAEAVETVLKGDKWCKIAIQLPEGV